LKLVSQKVEAIICISEYTRQMLLAHFNEIAPERTHTIHVCIHSRLESALTTAAPLEQFGLDKRSYMFYPANFWPHKNHRLLLTAYSILLQRRPGLDLDLVFTGALVEPEKELRLAVEKMGLTDRVHFLGYLSDEQLAAVFSGCQFIIYPSLYEGFGIPLIEAFAYGKPVLCSHITSLPEIGGDAASYFDPRKPVEIVQAIETLLDQPQLAETLIERGYQQLTKFDQAVMTRRYVEIFDQILQQEARNITELIGIFPDGWLGQDVEIDYESNPHTRTLELSLSVPPWLPHQKITIQRQNNGHTAEKWALSRGQTTTLRFPINPEGGYILLNISPVFNPKEHSISNDERWLSCICRSCQIIYSDGSRKALFEVSK
ncbi:MAG: glycosyltransferase family 4 protein, partial [Anaerolineaceae bacterium]|nr:glycosyltransferase family 4 protein [Anaerolineaceae bacterium]